MKSDEWATTRVTVGITAIVDAEHHRKLKAIAKERKVTLGLLAQLLLVWGASQDGPSLVRLGVGLPTWPRDLTT